MDPKEAIEELEKMDSQILGGRGRGNKPSFFKQLAELIRDLECVAGKPPHPSLKGQYPVVLYFKTAEERDAVIQAAMQENPNLRPMRLRE